MTGIGVGLLWFAYWWGLSGYSLLRGYNNNPLQLANPVKLVTFTTQCYTGDGIFPSGDPGDSGSCGGGGSAKPPGTATGGGVKPVKGKCQPGFKIGPDGQCHRIPDPGTGAH